jgi:hypothetical protein
LGQSGAKSPGCYAGGTAENLRQIALVGEPDFDGDRGDRLAGRPPFHDVSARDTETIPNLFRCFSFPEGCADSVDVLVRIRCYREPKSGL